MEVEKISKLLDDVYEFSIQATPLNQFRQIETIKKKIEQWKSADSETKRLEIAKDIKQFITPHMGSYLDITVYPPDAVDVRDPAIQSAMIALNKQFHQIYRAAWDALKDYIEAVEN